MCAMSKYTCQAKKDSCSGEGARPQSEHVWKAGFCRLDGGQANQRGNVQEGGDDDEDAENAKVSSFPHSMRIRMVLGIDWLWAAWRGKKKEMEFKINKYENRRKAEGEL